MWYGQEKARHRGGLKEVGWRRSGGAIEAIELVHHLDQARWIEAEYAFLHFYPELMRFCEAQIAAHRTATSSPP